MQSAAIDRCTGSVVRSARSCGPARYHLLVYFALCVGVFAGCAPKPRAFKVPVLVGPQRIAILPLSNYTSERDIPDKVRPVLAAEIGGQRGIDIVDPGAVEEALSREPWLIFDRIPPDLSSRLGEQLNADALLVGAILGAGYRQSETERIPYFSISMRLVSVPEARVLWSVTHNRDGGDKEWLFGFGRVSNLEQLITATVVECLRTFPTTGPVMDSLSAVSSSGGTP